MSAEDYIDFSTAFDQMDECYGDGDSDFSHSRHLSSPVSKRCNRCNKGGLSWGLTEKGWRLFGTKGMHVCYLTEETWK